MIMINKLKRIYLRIRRRYREFLYNKVYPEEPFNILSSEEGDYRNYGFPALPADVDHEDVLAKFQYNGKYWLIVKDHAQTKEN